MQEIMRMKALEAHIGSTYTSPDIETIISLKRSEQIELIKHKPVHQRISCNT